MTEAAEMAKSDTADNIFGQKSGPALAGPAGPATTALLLSNNIIKLLLLYYTMT